MRQRGRMTLWIPFCFLLIHDDPNICSGSLTHLGGAVELWNSVGVDFAVSLGDLIDGQNAGKSGQGNRRTIAYLD